MRRFSPPVLPVLRRGAALALLAAAPVSAEVQVDRIFLPHEASPSSFAVGLPGGLSFCFDPLRGAVSYVWRGGFIDPTPSRPGTGKFFEAATLLGPVVYRESGPAPLRPGDPARAPAVELTGYTIGADAIEFRYTVDGRPVREEIRARPDGRALVRRLRLPEGSRERWWRVVAGREPEALAPGPDGWLVIELPLAAEGLPP